MSEQLITIILSAVLSMAGSIGIARWSRTKAERESGLASDYLKIADMSGEQLEKKINQITSLEQEIAKLRKEFRRVERELSDWRNYAARLSRQLIEEAHITPAPFLLTPDTEEAIQAITDERKKFQEGRKP